VNIALANEFALIAENLGVNVWEAIDLANRHPRVNILKPGPGVGGHCIAVDPWFLVEAAPEITPLIKTARKVNDGMPSHVCEVVKQTIGEVTGFGDQPIVAVLGLAYKADVDDCRESPAWAVIAELELTGHQVKLHDPLVKDLHGAKYELCSLEQAVTDADCIVILTDHLPYSEIDPNSIHGLVNQRYVIDTRKCIDTNNWQNAGFEVVILGNTSQTKCN
jgi:UDP-N-acetyl-D-mannosaminuronic acid dehydrogenase